MSRLFIISNRLPLTIEHTGTQYFYRQSSGGLVSAVTAYLEQEDRSQFTRKIWMGVSECSEKIWAASTANVNADYDFQPVFVDAKTYDQYYNGFSNSVLWPLFHYFPSFADYQPAFFEAYQKVNQKFAQELQQVLQHGDTVWIHDYHLLPLAGLLRRRHAALTIGLFLHIPFPSYELFRVIPRNWQHELLSGMLGADVIGFHTADYLGHFLNCVQKVARARVEHHAVLTGGRRTIVGAFPIGIDYRRFYEAAADRKVLLKRAEYLRTKQDKKLLFSVDRLDYTKGVFNRMKGYREFLVQNPGYRGKVVFALVIVPSRDTIGKYAERKKMIDEYIGNFNSRFGHIGWQPVLYQYGHLSFEELIGLYTACDLALITPLRDGMNLVAKEFVASRRDRQGVLVLSEMAGAAEELKEALLINPNDRKEIAFMIRRGLEMEPAEQEMRMAAMQERISRYNVVAWARDFFDELGRTQQQYKQLSPQLLDDFSKAKLFEQYRRAKSRLFLLDYDGTLVPFTTNPQNASPAPEIVQVLNELAEDPLNSVYVISGRDSRSLEKWLGHLPIGIIAEHGTKVRHNGEDWTFSGNERLTAGLVQAGTLMEAYVQDCPGTFVERKDFSIAWHYRTAEATIAEIKARSLLHDLECRFDPLEFSILNGHKVIELKGAAHNKGKAVERLLQKQTYDFVFCAGDDQTDEDMFEALTGNQSSWTIKVGSGPSAAVYNLLTPYLVHTLLARMTEKTESI